MCLVISFVFSYLAYSFYLDNDIPNTIINGTIAVFFLLLLARNIYKTKKERKNSSSI